MTSSLTSFPCLPFMPRLPAFFIADRILGYIYSIDLYNKCGSYKHFAIGFIYMCVAAYWSYSVSGGTDTVWNDCWQPLHHELSLRFGLRRIFKGSGDILVLKTEILMTVVL